MSFSWDIAWHYLRPQQSTKRRNHLRWWTVGCVLLTLMVFGVDALCQKYGWFFQISQFFRHQFFKLSIDLDWHSKTIKMALMYAKYATVFATVFFAVLIELFNRFTIFTTISITGLFLGISSLMIVLGVQNGTAKDLTDKMMSLHAHLFIAPTANNHEFTEYRSLMSDLKKIDQVVMVAPYLKEDMFLSSQWTLNNQGVIVKGIDPKEEASELKTAMKAGHLEDLLTPEKVVSYATALNPEEHLPELARPMRGIVLGKELAEGIFGGYRQEPAWFLGKVVSLTSARGSQSPMGEAPLQEDFYVVGIFQSGFSDYDSLYAFITIPKMQRLVGLDEDEVTGIEIRVTDPEHVEKVKAQVEKLLGAQYEVKDWKQKNKAWFSSLDMERKAMLVILWMIILVAAGSLVGNAFMLVWDKKKEIGILKTLGATAFQISQIFLAVGLSIGMVGVGLGCILGGIGCVALRAFGLPMDPDLWQETQFPVYLSYIELSSMLGGSLALVLIATLYPAKMASRLSPLEAFRG